MNQLKIKNHLQFTQIKKEKGSSEIKIKRCDEILALLDGMSAIESSNILKEFDIKVTKYICTVNLY